MPHNYAKAPTMIRTVISLFVAIFLVMSAIAPAAFARSGDPSWRQELGTFRIGIVAAGRPVLETRRVQPFREALQGVLGIPVEIFAAPDYNALIEAHRGSRIEYAVYSASSFSAAWLLCKCVTPIAAPAASDGSARFRSVLIARKSAARTLAGLRDAKILVPGTDSFSGSIFPRDQLAREGIDMDTRGWTLRDMETMDAAIAAFAAGEGDAIFGWKNENAPAPSSGPQPSDTLDRLGVLSDDIGVVWQSQPVPYGPHAIRSSVSEEAKALILPFLIGLNRENPEAYEAMETRHAGGFQPVGFEDYRPVVDALRKTLLFATPASE